MPRIWLSFLRFPLGSLLSLVCLLSVPSAHAQNSALTITPAPTTSTLNVQAILPAAITYSATGDLYIADAGDHVILRRTSDGIVTVIAGDRRQGFSGDGGPAISASLDTPLGLAFDSIGNLYIADAHNHRIRRISGQGIITTIAGNGLCGLSGDGSAAALANLCLPSAIAVASDGTLAIADQRNHRIRKIDASGIITTIAGNGEQTFSGDGGQAADAGLDSPAGLAFDAAGNLYLSDTHNQRIRRVDLAGIITTVAGNGSPGSAGDNGNSTAAQLAHPTGITVTSAGDILFADSGNQRIRAVAGTGISTLAGNADQADTASSLSSARTVATSAAGDISYSGGILRQVAPAALAFGMQKIASASAPQSLLLTNTSSNPLSLRSLTLPGGFALGQGSCPTLPSTLAPGANCTLSLLYVPASVAASRGAAQLRVDGLPLQTIRLSGSGYSPATTTGLTPLGITYAGIPVTLTATITASGPAVPTGIVRFTDGGTPLGQATLTGSTANFTTSAFTAGEHSITASYSGDANFDASTSSPLLASITPVSSFTLAQDAGSSPSVSIAAGSSAQFRFAVTIPPASLVTPVILTASGLPNGATVSFAPASLASSGTVTMTLQTSPKAAWIPILFLTPAILLFARRRRRIAVCTVCCLFLLPGCGGGSVRQLSSGYTITVTARATTVAGTQVQQQLNVSLTIL